MEFSEMKKSVILEADGGFKTVYSMPEPQPPITINVEMPTPAAPPTVSADTVGNTAASTETQIESAIKQLSNSLTAFASIFQEAKPFLSPSKITKIIDSVETLETFLKESSRKTQKPKLTVPSKISLSEAETAVRTFLATHPQATDEQRHAFIAAVVSQLNDRALLNSFEVKK